ncbi:MAG: response regulator [Planctomycetaceae bacterium]|nr:response regulator [Planctomycetaceae bacterium]
MTRILVVDDSPMDRRLVTGMLNKRSDWATETAENGAVAFELLGPGKLPDLVLTDMQMPEMNGLELVRAVKRDFPGLPVILMTAQGSEALAVKALQVGADSYVPKALLADDLVETVERVLALAGERKVQQTLMQHMQTMSCSFQLSNDPKMLTSLVGFVQGIIHDAQLFGEAERLRVGVAFEEALLNAAYHGNLEVSSDLRETDHSAYYALARVRAETPPYCQRTIRIDIDVSPDGVSYTIEDQGPGFDPSKLPDPTDPANLERPCGRGLLLMRTFMDEVTYNDKGNLVRMRKQSKVTNGYATAGRG